MRKFLIFISIFTILFTVCGCSRDNSSSVKSESNIDDSQLVVNQFKDIYALFDFIENADMKQIENDKFIRYTLQPETTYEGYSSKKIPIKEEFIDFISNYTAIETFFSSNGLNVNVASVVLFDSYLTPITICVAHNQGCSFITVNEKTANKISINNDSNYNQEYVYFYYSQQDYCNEFGCVDYRITVLQTELDKKIEAIGYEDIVEVPVMSILTQLGADIKWLIKGKQAVVNYKDQKYSVDLEQSTFKTVDGMNMLEPFLGGTYVIRSDKEDLYITTTQLISLLYDLGTPIKVTIDSDNRTVTVNLR